MPPLHLADLPGELLDLIITHLSFPDTTHLRATCALFAGLIPPQPSTWRDLLAAEDSAWARKRNRLACVACARLLPAPRFSDAQKIDENKRREWRTCWECCCEQRVAAAAEEGGVVLARVLARGGRGDGRGTKTVFSRERKVVVGRERGVCTAGCENAFVRRAVDTGRVDQTTCPRCERVRWEGCVETMAEGGRVWRDLGRAEERRGARTGPRRGGGRVDVGRWGDWGYEWEVYDARRVGAEWDYGYGYCSCCLGGDEPFRGWREGWRGVNVIKVER